MNYKSIFKKLGLIGLMVSTLPACDSGSASGTWQIDYVDSLSLSVSAADRSAICDGAVGTEIPIDLGGSVDRRFYSTSWSYDGQTQNNSPLRMGPISENDDYYSSIHNVACSDLIVQVNNEDFLGFGPANYATLYNDTNGSLATDLNGRCLVRKTMPRQKRWVEFRIVIKGSPATQSHTDSNGNITTTSDAANRDRTFTVDCGV